MEQVPSVRACQYVCACVCVRVHVFQKHCTVVKQLLVIHSLNV